MDNESTRQEWRDERLGLARVVRCKGTLPEWLAWLRWSDDFRPIDDSAEAVLEWLEHAIARGSTLDLWDEGEPLHNQDISLACLASLVRNGWLLADRLRANGWRHLPQEPNDGELSIAGAIRALRQLRDSIADALVAKMPQAATETPAGDEGDGKGAPPMGGTSRYDALDNVLPVHRKAYLSFSYAEAKNERRLQDHEAWEWLYENGIDEDGGELIGYDLPSFQTWGRYLRRVRRAIGERKYTPRTGR